MKKFKINNEEPELVAEILEQIKNNGGYCPCKIIHDQDTKCMCKEFKEILKSKEESIYDTCACGLYKIEEE